MENLETLSINFKPSQNTQSLKFTLLLIMLTCFSHPSSQRLHWDSLHTYSLWSSRSVRLAWCCRTCLLSTVILILSLCLVSCSQVLNFMIFVCKVTRLWSLITLIFDHWFGFVYLNHVFQRNWTTAASSLSASPGVHRYIAWILYTAYFLYC